MESNNNNISENQYNDQLLEKLDQILPGLKARFWLDQHFFLDILRKLFYSNYEGYLSLWDILKKVTHPDYENELGNKYFLRQWSKL